MLDNHDNARFLSFQSDPALYKAALSFVLMNEVCWNILWVVQPPFLDTVVCWREVYRDSTL